MLAIRLTRVGKKKDASFRVVVIDSKRKVQAGSYLEMVGSYDPRSNKSDLKADRIKHWISMGAQPSDTVHNLFVSNKIIDAKKINVLPKKVLPKPEPVPSPEGEPAAPAEAPAVEAAPEPVVPAEAVAAETIEEKAAETPVDAAPAAEDSAVVEEKPAE